MNFILPVLSFAVGTSIIAGTIFSAVETFVLPRSAPDRLTQGVFLVVRWLFGLRLKHTQSYAERDRIMAFFAPFALLSLVPVWYFLITVGYMCLYWALGAGSWYQTFVLSGSSLLTLGFSPPDGLGATLLAFSEAALGLILVALLIAYLPTMYAAFSRREAAVTLLEVRAGEPPSALEMILRFHRIHGLQRLTEQWQLWETWFADIEESHTSLPALVFFRSPHSGHSWVTASGAVLDSAALLLAAIDLPEDPQAALCIRAGYLALRRIADFFGLRYPSDPHYPREPISVTRAEFDAVCERLAAENVPLKTDRDLAWSSFAGWRVNYDRVLIGLASMTMAPSAPWSADRAPENLAPQIFRHK